MRYKCLVLDHDDTVVNSTATINYPAFVQTLQKLRPDVHMTLDDFFSYSFEPGFGALCSDILGFSDAEMDIQYQTWLDYVRTHVPDTFPGMRDLLQRFHAAGGHICVVSHSVPENILRDYRAHDLPTPERIYGWDSDPERRKPAPWPIYQIERELSLRPEQLVVIDDLKPGKDMADRAGVDFIAAGWTHTVPHIIETMQRICPHYCRTVAELAALLLDETGKEYPLPEGTQSGTPFRLKGKGIPELNGRGRGDQYVTVYIETPRNLNREQKEALKKFAESVGDNNYEERKKFFKKFKK